MDCTTAAFQASNLRHLTRLRSIDIVDAAEQTKPILSDVIAASPLLNFIFLHGLIDDMIDGGLIGVLERFGEMGQVTAHLELSLDINIQRGTAPAPLRNMNEAQVTNFVQGDIQG